MLRNYLKIAIRNLFRNSVYSIINIGGLAIGIVCSLLIFLWVWDEVTYDRFHANADHVGKVMVTDYFSGNAATHMASPLGPYEFLKTFDSHIKNTAVAFWPSNHLLSIEGKRVNKQGQFVSPEFLQMFQFPLVSGSRDALSDPKSIILTESVAKVLFGDQDPMGKTVRMDNSDDYKVAAVLKDLPKNSTYDFEFLAPWIVYGNSWAKGDRDNWDNESYPVCVEWQPGTDLNALNAKLTALIREKRKEGKSEMFLQPMTDWRLYSHFKNGKQDGGMIETVRLFSVIATFILVIACINFMNLATARSERRAREVGIRKTVGSRRRELIGQFIGESVMITALAFIAAIILVELLLPMFNNLVQKRLMIHYSSPAFWGLSLLFIFIVGFFAGSYPAFYLSSFNAVKVLKGNLNAARGGATPRKVLVSLQFFFSIFLIIGTIVVYTQIQHVKNRSVGYDRENLVSIEVNEEMMKNFKAIEGELLSNRLAQSITLSSSPVTEIYGNNTLEWPGKPADQDVLFSRVTVGYHYAKTLGVQVLQGRDFSEDFKSDSSAMLINRAAVEAMGLKNPIGEQIKLWGRTWTVVGVLENVLMNNPFRDVQPGFFLHASEKGESVGVMTVRLEKTNDLKKSLAEMESIFKRHNPSYPFSYQFVDLQFANKFASINLTGTLASLFAVLAISITCLGLFGLATFTAEQRTKEIGIRRVLGASSSSIVSLLSRDFTILVLVGFVLAAPISWWLLSRYLESYNYRVAIAWWIIPAAGLLALLLTLVIVSTQALRVIATNPSQSLRNE